MNRKQEETLKEERNKLENEIERAEDVWETTKTEEGETLRGLSDKQKLSIVRKIERVDYLNEWLRTGIKPTRLRGRMFNSLEEKRLIRESFVGVKELRDKRIGKERLEFLQKEGVARGRKTEGRKLSEALKALEENNWKLFLTRFEKIKDPDQLSEKSLKKYTRIKAGISKGLPMKEIVKLAQETPGKWRAHRVTRQKVPDWKTLSREEHEEAIKKERGKAQYELKGIKKWDVLFSIVIFIPVLLYILFLLAQRGKSMVKAPYDPNATGQVHSTQRIH